MIYLKRACVLSALLVAMGTLTAPAQDKVQPKVPAADGRKVLKDIAYGPHERNKLDLYLPKGDGPAPVVVWIHGGGWERAPRTGTIPPYRCSVKGMRWRASTTA